MKKADWFLISIFLISFFLKIHAYPFATLTLILGCFLGISYYTNRAIKKKKEYFLVSLILLGICFGFMYYPGWELVVWLSFPPAIIYSIYRGVVKD